MGIDGSSRLRTGMVVAFAMSLGACGGGAEAVDTEAVNEADAGFTRVLNVEVETVAAERFVERIALTGVALANRDVQVAAEQMGRVRSVFVEKGSRVRSGQAIAKIADDGVQAEVARAQAQAALAQETWDRRRRLFEEDRVGSELAYLEARYGAEQAQAALTALQDQLDKTVIRAPFSGVLDDRMIEVGSMVSPGTPVARVIDLTPTRIAAGVPERYTLDVHEGTAVTVTFDVMPGEVFEGAISYVGSAVNPDNRTFPVELEIPNEDGRIKPQMVASLSLARNVVESAIVVPQEALVRIEDGYVVFVVEEQDGQTVARRRVVDRGAGQRDQVVIRSGVSEGDRLVVVGQQQVADGDRVRVVAR